MLRARMKSEAARILGMITDQNRSDAAFDATREAALLRRAARLALEAGAIDLATAAASVLPKTLTGGATDEYLRTDDLTASVQLLLQLHRNTEARSLIDSFREARAEDKNFASTIEQCDRMWRLFTGDERDLTPTIFLSAAPPEGGKSAIYWDLAGLTGNPYARRDASTISAVEGVPPPFSRPRRLTILAGESETHLIRAAEIRTREWRGQLRVALPRNAHFGRVIVSSENGDEIVGAAIPLNLTPNLIFNSTFDGVAGLGELDQSARAIPGWGELPEGDWSVAKSDFPRRAIRYRSTKERQVSIAGQRIPVSPNDEFFQSAWIRLQPREGRLRIGRRYLNHDGVELGVSYFPVTEASGTWQLLQQKLLRVPDGGSDRIPGGCVFLEPVLQVTTNSPEYDMIREPAVWAEMYLGRLPRSAEEEPPSPNESVFFSAKERPAVIVVAGDSRFIALGYASGAIRLLDRHGKQQAETSVGSSPIISLYFLRDSSALIGFGAHGEIFRLTLAPPFQTTTLMPAAGDIREAGITPDGATAVVFRIGRSKTSEGESGRFEIIDLGTGKVVRTLEVGWNDVINFVISEDGTRFFAISNSAIRFTLPRKLWLLPSGEEVPLTAAQLEGKMDYFEVLGKPSPSLLEGNHVGQKIHALAHDPARHRAIYAGEGKLFVYDRIAHRDLWVFPDRDEVRRLAVIPDDGTVLGIGADGAIRQWKLPK